MNTTCVVKVPNDKICILKKSYLDICYGNKGAAYLLNYFIYWHDIKSSLVTKNITSNDVAESHGDNRYNDESLYQFHKSTEIYNDLLGAVGKSAIEEGIKILKSLEFISLHKNPNPRYKFDNTRFFLVHPDKINIELKTLLNWDSRNNQKGKAVNPNEYDGQPKLVKRSTQIGKNNTKDFFQDYSIDSLQDKKESLSSKNKQTEITETINQAKEIAFYLNSKIKSTSPNAITEPDSWIKDIELAIRRDKRKPKDLIKLIDYIYTAKGQFWQSNIMSGNKLRKKFDTIWMQSLTKQTKTLTAYQEVVQGQAERDMQASQTQMKDINPQQQAKISDEYFT
jgi:hypothetical protein